MALKSEHQKENAKMDNLIEMTKKEYNNAVSQSSQLEKYNDKMRN